MANPLDPILKSCEWKAFATSNPSLSPEPGRAIVLAGNKQPLLVIRYGDRGGPGRAQMFIGKYNRFYEIDVTERPLSFEETLQSKDDIAGFRATVNVSCLVRDPAKIVEHGVRDVLAAIRPLIIDAMTEITVRYRVEEVSQAWQEIRRLNPASLRHSSLSITHLSIKLTLTEEPEKLVNARVTQRLSHLNEIEKVDLDDRISDARTLRSSRLIEQGSKALLAEHLARNPDDAIKVAQVLSDQHEKTIKGLERVDSIEDPRVKEAMLQQLTGKPAGRLNGGSDFKDSRNDYDIITADDDDEPDEFSRDSA